MDIWERLYKAAAKEFKPGNVTEFIYAHHVVSAIEAANGDIFKGFCIESCCGVCDLCAERVAALNMYVNSGQTQIKRMICFRDKPPLGKGSGMPCGACREFLMQLDQKNSDIQIMDNYEKRTIIRLGDLIPNWWGQIKMVDPSPAEDD